MGSLSLLVVLSAFTVGAAGQEPASVVLYIGPVPNPNGLVTPVPKDFAASYEDLKKAHAEAGGGLVTLVDDPALGDAILSVTHRGDVSNGSTVSVGVPISMGATVTGTEHVTRTLRGRLTVRSTGQGAEFSGVANPGDDRARWSTQAKRIYQQAAAWLAANESTLVRLRQR